jgi:hypothetical protein
VTEPKINPVEPVLLLNTSAAKFVSAPSDTAAIVNVRASMEPHAKRWHALEHGSFTYLNVTIETGGTQFRKNELAVEAMKVVHPGLRCEAGGCEANQPLPEPETTARPE